MRQTTILLLIVCLHIAAASQSQGITLKLKDASLEKLFTEIKKQTGYVVFYDYSIVKDAKPVTVDVKNVSLEQLLTEGFKQQSLAFTIEGKTVFVTKKLSEPKPNTKNGTNLSPPIDVKGKVVDQEGKPVLATVTVKGANKATKTNDQGEFVLTGVDDDAILIITGVNIETTAVGVNGRLELSIATETKVTSLNEVIINKGYYTEQQKLSTGNVGKITAKEIGKQPVNNPLATLAGRVPGLIVTETSGNAGAAFNIQIRGRNSIAQGSTPLFLVDGIPYPNVSIGPNNSIIGTANRSQSHFVNINPQDIEAIEVLKDADATAIYGSRGANGVILITTKKGKAGRTKVDINVYAGAGMVSRKIKLLNTADYILMRKEAFSNDGLIPSPLSSPSAGYAYAPDLKLWDTIRYTDWQELLIGGTAKFTNANVNVSGGNTHTQFLIGANYSKQTTVYPTDVADNRGTLHFNISNTSLNNKFSLVFSGNYSNGRNELPSQDLTSDILRAPNSPGLYDSLGRLNWSENGGVVSTNPAAAILRSSKAVTDNVLGNLKVNYTIWEGVHVQLNGGFTLLQFNQQSLNPKSAQNPNGSPAPNASSTFSSSMLKTWILEPQIEYSRPTFKGIFTILVGATTQKDIRNQTVVNASGFPNDDLISAATFATTVTSATSLIDYRYQALFGRVNYNWANKYLINLTARRDGSSRFGPDKQTANFGAVGAGWIFTEENFIKRALGFLNHGKIRVSYGITGNDQIGDYLFRDNYISAGNPYQGQAGYAPARLFNADYRWEQNKKLEVALELDLFNGRLQVGTSYYRNRSGDQLIDYKLPSQTGFASILKNFDAVVQNQGWEFAVNGQVIKQREFSWTSSFNLTVFRNKLVSFPDFEASTYANTYVIGKSLNIVKRFEFLGVDPTTGIYQFNGTSIPNNQTSIVDLTPRYFGGWNNVIAYRNFDLSFFFQFIRQTGYDFSVASNLPGSINNQPYEMLQRWQKTGDQTSIQKFSTTGAAATAYSNFIRNSDGVFANTSFVRLKNVSLSYTLPTSLTEKINVSLARVYLQGQNLLTITKYKGLDPETSLGIGQPSLPTLRVLTAGIQITL